MLVYKENKYKYFWRIVVTVATGFMTIFLPLKLVFNTDFSSYSYLLYWISTAVFAIDMILNIRKEMNSREDFWTGLSTKSQFLIVFDILAAIPFACLVPASWLWVVQIVKVTRVQQYMNQLKHAEVRHALTLTLLFFGFWIIPLVHWLCCGWLVIHGFNTGIDVATNYISSLYWTVTTMTAVGYGDIVPLSNGERLYTIFIQITGVGVVGYLIGSLVSILSKKDPVVSNYIENVERLTHTLKRRDLPVNLQQRILSYYSYLRDEKMGYDESTFLDSLPDSLKEETSFHLKKDFIEEIHLFKNASEKFIYEIALKLELVVAIPGEYIFKYGDHGKDMYFIISGQVQVLGEDGRLINILKDGDFFGEIALIKTAARSASVKALSYCNLYVLKSHTFKHMIDMHPEIVEQIEEEAKLREERLMDLNGD